MITAGIIMIVTKLANEFQCVQARRRGPTSLGPGVPSLSHGLLIMITVHRRPGLDRVDNHPL
jgi:hypothetical protein